MSGDPTSESSSAGSLPNAGAPNAAAPNTAGQDMPELEELPLAALADAGIGKAVDLGASYADVRVERIRSQLVALRDAVVTTTVDDTEVGAGLRVVLDGSLGFAATVELTSDALAGLAEDASAIARATSSALEVPVRLAEEPPHGTVGWSSYYEIDPTEVALAEKIAVLEDWSRRLLAAAGVDHVEAMVLAVVEDKYFCNSGGTIATQRRVRIRPVFEVFSVDSETGAFESMRSVAPPVARGWEYVTLREGPGARSSSTSRAVAVDGGARIGSGAVLWDWDWEIEKVPELLAEKVRSPSVDAGTYDLVIDPSNLWLTIHESIGHATELDRALGYEAAYAGTSFATFDKLGSLHYGTPIMHVTGDRTVVNGLATVGYDDEGVEAQSFDIVRDGVLVGYQLDRRMAAENGFERSNGCAFADSPAHVPIQRMANVSLQPAGGNDIGGNGIGGNGIGGHGIGDDGMGGDGPTTEDLISGVDDGIYIIGDKSWSIDMQRYNFQFTGQRFFRISNGRLNGQLRDVAYQSRTTDFWGSMEAVGGPSTYVLGGAFNCGKGQPGQVAPVSHGCPSALFRSVNVLNTRAEAGR
jgi:TldD protein